jgi:methionine-S-sulfoxide reductase
MGDRIVKITEIALSWEENSFMTHSTDDTAIATFAGGCFWCMQHPFDELDGVISTTSGYTGGHKTDPTYQEVSAGTTGHTEAMQVCYDPTKVSYENLLDIFWRNINPADADGQFVDRGSQYRPAIFYHDEVQKRLATESRDRLAASGRFQSPIVIEIVPAETFYPAEDYHQGYYLNNPMQYKLYRYNSGRDRFLKKFWGDGGED